jgi:signal transduction histidine kinase
MDTFVGLLVMKQLVRNLIIGKSRYIDSWCEFKQVMLSGQFILIALFFSVFYLLLDAFRGTIQTIPIYSLTIVLLLSAIYLHRKGSHCAANYFLFPTLIVLLYLIASSEPYTTGAFLFFIPIAIGAFAVFEYKQRLISIFIAIGAYAAFCAAYFMGFSLLPKRAYSEDEMLLTFIINFSAALLTSLTAIYLLIRLTHYNAQQLILSNKMLLKNNEELDRFVYSTSHDLRAPLASISGLIELTNKTNEPTEMRMYLGLMQNRIKSLESFIGDITDFSRNSRHRVIKEEVNLAAIAADVWESLRYAPETNGISFDIDIPEGLLVNTDKKRIQIILSNLVSNAVRYHDNRKEDKYIKVSYKATAQSFSITVEDNGQGIAPEYQMKIFEMFFRGNESSKGTGLGLYIVQETLQKLSGSVKLQSAPNAGSSFTIVIPQQ